MIRKHFLRRAAAAFAVMLAVTSVSTVSASAEIEIGDRNGDGVVNAYDYVLVKRDTVEECAPLTLSVSSADCYPGKTVRLRVSMKDNPGCQFVSFLVRYPQELTLLNGAESVRLSEDCFADEPANVFLSEENHSIMYMLSCSSLCEDNGQMMELEFQVSKDAQPGMLSPVTLERINLRGAEGRLPMLTERGKVRVRPVPSSKMATALKGADVSQWQGDIDWEKFAANSDINYVMLRAGYGKTVKQTDKKFKRNYAGAKAAGLPVGCYWYSYAMTPEEAVKEAHVCAEVIKGCVFEYPVAFDFEEPNQLKLPVAKASAIIDAFCKEMESMGYYSTLYCSSYYLNHTVSKEVRQRYDIWVAHYNVSKPAYEGNYGMWQYGIEKNKDGVSGAVDMNYCYRDYPEIMNYSERNGCILS